MKNQINFLITVLLVTNYLESADLKNSDDVFSLKSHVSIQAKQVKVVASTGSPQVGGDVDLTKTVDQGVVRRFSISKSFREACRKRTISEGDSVDLGSNSEERFVGQGLGECVADDPGFGLDESTVGLIFGEQKKEKGKKFSKREQRYQK